MTEKIEIIEGCGNVFRDAGLSDPDTKLMKADIAAEIIGTLRRRKLANRQVAELAGIQEADVSRICNADLGRFTIDRLVKVLNRLDRKVEVKVTFRPRHGNTEAGQFLHA